MKIYATVEAKDRWGIAMAFRAIEQELWFGHSQGRVVNGMWRYSYKLAQSTPAAESELEQAMREERAREIEQRLKPYRDQFSARAWHTLRRGLWSLNAGSWEEFLEIVRMGMNGRLASVRGLGVKICQDAQQVLLGEVDDASLKLERRYDGAGEGEPDDGEH